MKLADEKLAASHGMQGSERHKALMKAKSSGILPGLLGRLGDLGGIDKKYDAAISTTTAALDSYVVETTDDGHAAIDFLVKNNFGRTNFITIDKTSEYKGNMDPPPGKKLVTSNLTFVIDLQKLNVIEYIFKSSVIVLLFDCLISLRFLTPVYVKSSTQP
uniref:SMC hinge domain-containing protein n=1 Tax=Heterorhabditis bacteriophora TaxID=37862 RepID=A0A1I7X700_HETBA